MNAMISGPQEVWSLVGEDNNVQSKDKTGSPEVLCESRMAIVPACLRIN